MKHAREDYNRIQDPDGIIPEDEPVFLLRGQDIFAPTVLLKYATYLRVAGADELADKVLEQAAAMVNWQKTCTRKVPDL